MLTTMALSSLTRSMTHSPFRYYYVGRRVFVETLDHKVAYYSSKEQLDALIGVFEETRDKDERRLRRTIIAHYETIVEHMDFTKDRTMAVMREENTMAEQAVDLAAPTKAYTIDEYAVCSEHAEDAFTVWRRQNTHLLTEPENRQVETLETPTPTPKEKAEEDKEEEDGGSGGGGGAADDDSADLLAMVDADGVVNDAAAEAAKEAAEETMARTAMEITAELSGTTVEALQAKKASQQVAVKEVTAEVSIPMGDDAEDDSWGAMLDPHAYPLAPGDAPEREEVHEWQRAIAPDTGREYFYHPLTKQAVWEKTETILWTKMMKSVDGTHIFRLGDSLEGCREYINSHEVGCIPPKIVTNKFHNSGQVLLSGVPLDDRADHAVTIA